MATYKVLGQSNPTAATATTLYTVPGGGVLSAVVSSVTVCNRSNTGTSFRLWVDPAGGGDSNEQYICYDVAIAGNDVYVLTAGLTLATTDLLRCYATLATLSFSAFGSEIT